jgi:hypothetical protein
MEEGLFFYLIKRKRTKTCLSFFSCGCKNMKRTPNVNRIFCVVNKFEMEKRLKIVMGDD